MEPVGAQGDLRGAETQHEMRVASLAQSPQALEQQLAPHGVAVQQTHVDAAAVGAVPPAEAATVANHPDSSDHVEP